MVDYDAGLTLSCVSLCVALVFVYAAVKRRWRLLRSEESYNLGVRKANELEVKLLEEKEEEAPLTYVVKSRVPLASRQIVYMCLFCFHACAAAWVLVAKEQKKESVNVEEVMGDVFLFLTWFMVYVGEGVDHAYVKLRAEPKAVSWLVAVVAFASLVQTCFAMKITGKTSTGTFLFLESSDMRPAAFWLDVVAVLLSTFWRSVAARAQPSTRPPSFEESALQLHEIVSFSWLTPTLLKANHKACLSVSDLPPTSGEDTSAELWNNFEKIFGPELQKPRSKGAAKRRIWLYMARLVWPQICAFAFFCLLSVVSEYLRVYAFNQFLTLLTAESSRQHNARAYWFSIGALFICPLMTASLQSLTSMLQTRMAMRCRAVLIRLIYRKSLRIDLGATGASVGEVVNLMSADVDSIVWTIAYSDTLWLPVLQASACLAFIFYLVGAAGFCALTIMATMAIVNNRAFKQVFSTQRKLMVKRDERLSSISEALTNIRLIKVAGMEKDVHALVSKLRNEELALILRFLTAIAALFSFISSGPKMAALSTFLVFTLGLGHRLSPAVGFTTLELLTNLEDSFTSLPSAVDCLARAATALSKLDEFLDVTEVTGVQFEHTSKNVGAFVDGSFKWSSSKKPEDIPEKGSDCDDDDFKSTKSMAPMKKKREGVSCFFNCGRSNELPPPPPMLELEDSKDEEASSPLITSADGLLHRDPDDDQTPTLRDIALELPKGALVLVVGPTGCGKSSLLAALCNEIAKFSGTSQRLSTLTGSSAALVPQKAWCQHATFRQNVAAFGADVDMRRYRRAIRACALEADLKLLNQGDRTKIGSRGINLSGGQQARINLARCVYARPDVALLDDPLSAVDAHVARHLYDKAILGELKNSTRILVTHQVDLAITKADYVVFIELGKVVEHGSREKLELKGSERLTEALRSSIKRKEDSEEAKEESEMQKVLSSNALLAEQEDMETKPIAGLDDHDDSKKKVEEEEGEENEENDEDDPENDENAEKRDKGAVKWAAYATYLNAVGSKTLLLFIFCVVVSSEIAGFLQSLAMASWISSMERGQRPNSYRMTFYIVAALGFVGLFTLGFCLRAVTQVKASKSLHELVLRKVLGAKVSFFDVTPVGRIQNRFSSDFQAVDRELAPAMYYFVMDCMNPISTFAAMVITAPILLAMLPAILLYDLRVARTYIKGARDMKRLSSLNKSPIYDRFSETLNGLAVIRAYKAENFCEKQLSDLVDTSIRCDRTQKLAFRWLGVRMEAFGSLLGGATATVLATLLFKKIDPSLSGFVLQYATAMCFIVKYVIDDIASLEISMNAMERLHEYANLEQEPEYHQHGEIDDSNPLQQLVVAQDPPSNWPQQGEIVAMNLVVRYPNTPKAVLNDLSFRFPPRTKTGIVGRTGAGKSTLTLAVLRMVPTEAGSLCIDGFDINKIKLERLRDAISVVPQDPAIFRGTVRSNLDARSIHPEQALKSALVRVQLGSMDLDRTVEDAGSNLAVGERQLLCLARALLRDRTMLVLDEATANVDVTSDQQIQHVIRNDMHDKAVLCIAHRLKTIIFYDNVAVLDKGQLIEFGSPQDLMAKTDTVFYTMCDATGDLNGLQTEANRAASEKLNRLQIQQHR